jgi:hypothetical protein
VPDASIIDRESFGELTARFSGRLLFPGDAGYEDARRIQNGLIDKRPGLIARCLGTADVVDAVNFARIRGIEVAIRGRAFMSIRSIAQCGVTCGAFNGATQLHGLATGWLMGKHGLALDNQPPVELVTASGEFLRSSERDNPGLF